MAQQKKALMLRELLAKQLAVFFPALAQTEGVDASGNPTLLVGASASTVAGAFIRIQQRPLVSKDVFGNTGAGFGPHEIDIGFEVTALNTPGVVGGIVALAAATGAVVQVYAIAEGAAPAVGALVVANLKSPVLRSLTGLSGNV